MSELKCVNVVRRSTIWAAAILGMCFWLFASTAHAQVAVKISRINTCLDSTARIFFTANFFDFNFKYKMRYSVNNGAWQESGEVMRPAKPGQTTEMIDIGNLPRNQYVRFQWVGVEVNNFGEHKPIASEIATVLMPGGPNQAHVGIDAQGRMLHAPYVCDTLAGAAAVGALGDVNGRHGIHLGKAFADTCNADDMAWVLQGDAMPPGVTVRAEWTAPGGNEFQNFSEWQRLAPLFEARSVVTSKPTSRYSIRFSTALPVNQEVDVRFRFEIPAVVLPKGQPTTVYSGLYRITRPGRHNQLVTPQVDLQQRSAAHAPLGSVQRCIRGRPLLPLNEPYETASTLQATWLWRSGPDGVANASVACKRPGIVPQLRLQTQAYTFGIPFVVLHTTGILRYDDKHPHVVSLHRSPQNYETATMQTEKKYIEFCNPFLGCLGNMVDVAVKDGIGRTHTFPGGLVALDVWYGKQSMSFAAEMYDGLKRTATKDTVDLSGLLLERDYLRYRCGLLISD